jgi:hypothetical protein
MSKSPPPTLECNLFSKFLSLVLPPLLSLMLLAGTISCGGGSTTPAGQGGGGGGGGNSANCSPSVPFSASPVSQAGVGKIVPSTFMDLHLGSSSLPWPTVPFGGLRLWDTATGWAQINSAQGVYDFSSNLDGFLQVAQTHNVDVLYNLARTPTWASSNPTDSTCSYDTTTQGGPGQCDAPNDLNVDGTGTDQHWIDWVTAVATHSVQSPYAHIKYYEIWNEWNASLFWTGTAAQLVRMEQDARCVVEGPPAGLTCNPNSTFDGGPGVGTAIDPSAQIVSPSPVGTASTLTAVQDNLNTYFGTVVGGYHGGQFADVIGFHGYVSTGKSGFCPIPEDVISVIDNMNTAITSASETGKPWFDTEDSWSKASDEDFLDQDREAAFLARYELLQFSMGVARGYWYRWDSTTDYEGALWTAASGPIEAAGAWDEVSNWMLGATFSTACTVKGTVWTCGLTRSGGYQALAVWDAGQDCLNGVCSTSTFTVPASGYTLYRDLTGTETSISDGSVLLGAKPILLETSTLP